MENKAFSLLFRKNKFKTFKPNTSSKGPLQVFSVWQS